MRQAEALTRSDDISHTVTRSHGYTCTQSNSNTVTLAHSHTHRHTQPTTRSHCNSQTLKQSHRQTLSHTVTQSNYHTIIQSDSPTVTQSHSHTRTHSLSFVVVLIHRTRSVQQQAPQARSHRGTLQTGRVGGGMGWWATRGMAKKAEERRSKRLAKRCP